MVKKAVSALFSAIAVLIIAAVVLIALYHSSPCLERLGDHRRERVQVDIAAFVEEGGRAR